MVQNTTQTPKPNEFLVPDCQGYAYTYVEAVAIIKFLMTKLEPIELEYLDAEDRVCSICRAELVISEDAKLSHAPVKTPCGHIFGKRCIIRWLDPVCAWGFKEDIDPNADPNAPLYEPGKSGCPICRQEFFPHCGVEPMEALAQRLTLWDMAYACAGVARSEKEETSRKYLWQYVDYCRLIDEHDLDRQTKMDHLECAQELLLDFARSLKTTTLTPEQEHLRMKLERIAKKDLEKCAFENGSYVFGIDRDDNERRDFGQF